MNQTNSTALNAKSKRLTKKKKANYTALIVACIMEKYSITVVCPHDIAEIKVLETVGTCETTVLVCTECGEELEKPKTEC